MDSFERVLESLKEVETVDLYLLLGHVNLMKYKSEQKCRNECLKFI